MPKSLEPHPIDVHVGQRIAVRRKLLKLSQTDLANHIGYTYQQVQKYEHGTNRDSASVLYEFSGALGVPASFFFEGLPDKASQLSRLKETRADGLRQRSHTQAGCHQAGAGFRSHHRPKGAQEASGDGESRRRRALT